ncbi:MAG: ABC transporter ATP-binding protein [Bacteroidales bacterium]|nr:ABC transporter ATP-binding protein [Bacteroidales bacterium]MCM1416113.1 ABC transporter ATP-binding protein [bacterium]MCM1422845.1 ABC transporter ATP-binding protein [bacterium]
MEILNVNELTKIYGSGDNRVVALDHVSFSVKKGEFIAIVGASGSGKSTLMNLIGGIDRPTSGTVTIDKEQIFAMSESALAIFRRRNIGIVYQFYNLIPNLTVEENIMLPCLLDNRKPDAQKLEKIIEMTGLSHRKGHLPGELSGGQQQRVSVGRALINDPAFILADEPTGNLDSKAGREIIELLTSANRKANQTLILITHDENIALQADRILTISDGRIVRDEVMRA